MELILIPLFWCKQGVMKEGGIVNVTIQDIMELTIMKDIRLVAGEQGLDHIVSWIYFAEHYKVRPWLNGGEIVIYSTMKENLKEDSIKKMLAVAKESGTAAVMIYVNDQFPKIPEEIIELADSLGVPLFEIPWEIKVVQLTREISNYIIKSNSIDDFAGDVFRKLLLGEKTEDYIDELGSLSAFGDINDFAIASVMVLVDNRIDTRLMNFLKNHFQYYLGNMYHSVCVCSINNVIVVYASVSSDKYMDFRKEIEEIVNNVSKNRKKFFCKAGISSVRYGKACIVEAFKESIEALKFIEKMDTNIIQYNDLGIEKIFYEVKNMKKLEDLYYAFIGILKQYDEKNDDSLYETLIAYLNHNCDIVNAAAALYIHKNSMRYRLKKIEGITGKSFSNMEDLTEFYNARKIGIFLKKES